MAKRPGTNQPALRVIAALELLSDYSLRHNLVDYWQDIELAIAACRKELDRSRKGRRSPSLH